MLGSRPHAQEAQGPGCSCHPTRCNSIGCTASRSCWYVPGCCSTHLLYLQHHNGPMDTYPRFPSQVGVCHPPEQAAAAASPSPARARSPYPPASSSSSSGLPSPGGGVTPSRFAPSPVVLQPDQVHLVDLWARAGMVQHTSAGRTTVCCQQ